MRRKLVVAGCLAVTAVLASAAKADPIMGTITLTAAPAEARGDGIGLPTAVVYSSGAVDLDKLGQTVTLTGPALGLSGPGVGTEIWESVQTTFDMKVSFDGASGSQPSIDVTGILNGAVAETQSPPSVFSEFGAGATSATVQGWTPGSGVPLALVNAYLNVSNYNINLPRISGTLPPETENIGLTVNPAVPAPEPATVLLYLAAIIGLGARRGVRALRPFSAC